MPSMFETRSQSWRDAGLARQVTKQALKRARIEAAALLALLTVVLVAYHDRKALFGSAFDTPARVITVIALIAIGWQFARDVGRVLQPLLYRRLDPATAGTVGFLLRLGFVVVATVAALRFAGLTAREVALGGAFTAVILGLAAQQTLGNLFAGIVLLSARPFRVGERVRMQGGPLAGTIEGVVSTLGLLYTTLANGADQIMVPNSVVLNVAVVPLREPAGVDLVARLEPGTTPEQVQLLLEERITVPLRGRARVELESVDRDEVVMRIVAVPERPHDGPTLASEVLDAVQGRTPARETS